MPDRHSGLPLRAAAVVLAAALLTGCGGQGGAPAPPESPAPTSASPTPAAADRAAVAPARVTIPSLGLDEELIDLGIDDETGELETPEDPDRVGWFTGGGKPGELYPTVIAGHKDSATGPAVFARLTELEVGEEFSLLDASGQRFTYRIDEVRDVPQDDDFPTDDVYAETTTPQARLITCTGPYDQGIGRYTENRVVFASMV